MTDHAAWSWAALLLLGVFHGLNPGMGWLFAVALGMQEHRRRAVWQAILPLGLGHALAIGCVVLLAAISGAMIPISTLRLVVAAVLIGLGAYRLVRHGHPRWRGMRVGMAGLTVWSFLMASAHGAGLMVLPVVLAAAPHDAAGHGSHTASVGNPMTALVVTAVHALGYLFTTALAAWLFYEILGLALLRKAWVNLDLVWAAALIVTGTITALI